MGKVLTTTAIDNLPIPASRREIYDGHTAGLVLVVQPSGKKSWAFRYRLKDRTSRKLTIGPYPGLSLKEARVRADRARLSVGEGGDPATAKQVARREERQATTDTVEAVVERYAERYLKAKGLRSCAETKRILEREAVPAWRGRALASITKKDVHALLDAVMDRGKPIMANRILAALRHMCGWAVERDIIQVSPCQGIKPPSSERTRDRVLDDGELAAVWKACDSIGDPFASLTRLLMLTGQRRDEIGGMRWSEIDVDRRTWTLPKDRAKNGAEHVVPLSPPALAILEAMPRIGDAGFVFTTNAVTAVSGFSRAKSRLDAALTAAGAELPPWRLHDLRRSFASGCASLGVALPVIERALNHVSGTFRGIVGVYQKHDFLTERRAAMDVWGRHIEGIVTGRQDNVVDLRRSGT